jgi:hypothetical protein
MTLALSLDGYADTKLSTIASTARHVFLSLIFENSWAICNVSGSLSKSNGEEARNLVCFPSPP